MHRERKSVLLTGGTRGIGRAVATYLAKNNFDLILTYRNNDESLSELLNECNLAGANVFPIKCDLANSHDVDSTTETLLAENRIPYGIVCCAGMSSDSLSFQFNSDSVKKIFQVNLFSTMQLVSKLIMPMSRMDSSRIIFISSVASKHGNRGNSIYSATKGAIQSYMRSVIEEFSRRGLTMNAILPGFIDTELTQGRANWADSMLNRIPVQRLGKPNDIATLVDFLLSPNASFINGSELIVDGGMTATLGLN
ncbi:SDR family oxidoreductase [Endozoicomonas sp. G2_1]|uniref:SDR family NAD(P)-dependent oxidoreductase n=1 Tax=Endozoicomonas sp. G2_1 TaxID=2821091 RepID=UPI001ADCD5E5|nr:SDR family NAD(P)-dependent oxidoreductase [Endozoicomonas sp. G2_1]MBO9489808.1 SDR family oxidoreductase [Endozoicomonas sp. G2_1]